MYIDIAFPKGNEKEFVDLAIKLGYGNLCFVYSSIKDIDGLKKLNGKYGINLYSGLLSKPEEIFRLKNKADLILVRGSDKDRFVLEKAKPDILSGLENKGRDSLHYRASGLNQVLCKLAKENDIYIGLDFSSLLIADDQQKAILLGRMRQNAKFCRKYKVKIVIASFAKKPMQLRSPHDLISFGIALGMHPSEAKKSLIQALEKVK